MAKQTPAQLRAQKKYQAANTLQLNLRLNKNTDSDIIERLNNVSSKRSKLGYIKDLIRKDISLNYEDPHRH